MPLAQHTDKRETMQQSKMYISQKLVPFFLRVKFLMKEFLLNLLNLPGFLNRVKVCRITHLSEFLDVAEFQIGNDEEYESHYDQSQVIFPQSPGGVFYPQVVQILLSCTSEEEEEESLLIPLGKSILCI